MSVDPRKKVNFIFEVIDKCEVKLTDYEVLSRVSRQTLHKWKNGSPVRDMLRLDYAYTLAGRLNHLHAVGTLPLKEKLTAKARVKYIHELITRQQSTAH